MAESTRRRSLVFGRVCKHYRQGLKTRARGKVPAVAVAVARNDVMQGWGQPETARNPLESLGAPSVCGHRDTK